jgi:hypothetical protein
VTELDPSPSPVRPLAAVTRYWKFTGGLCLILLLAGAVAGGAKAPVYTAETRLAIGGQDLTSQAVAGFASASQELASDYARYVSLPQDAGPLKSALGNQAAQISGLSATNVPSSNLVSIEALSKDPTLAMKAATAAGAALMAATNVETNDAAAAALLAQYDTLSSTVATSTQTLQTAQQKLAKLTAATSTTASELTAAQQAVVAASTKNASLVLQQSALGVRYQQVVTADTPSSNLTTVQPAVIVLTNKTKNRELFALVGLALAIVISFLLATFYARLSARKSSRRAAVESFAGPVNPNTAKLPVAPVASRTAGPTHENAPELEPALSHVTVTSPRPPIRPPRPKIAGGRSVGGKDRNSKTVGQ